MIHAKQALLAEGWADNVRLTIDAGTILRIETDAAARTGDARVDTLLPSLGNLHSHAFQRAMAGMTEFRQAGRDSFWTWRDLMYRFMDRMTPEQIEAIAAQVYVEMLEAGFASVGSFTMSTTSRAGGLTITPPNSRSGFLPPRRRRGSG